MSVPVIGIDLGTTNSVVAYADESGSVTVIPDENGDRIIPSVIHFGPDGNVVVGRYARGSNRNGWRGSSSAEWAPPPSFPASSRSSSMARRGRRRSSPLAS